VAETWQNVVADARIALPGIPAYTDAVTLRLGNRVFKELIEEFRLMTTETDVTLDGTSREFTLNENHVGVWNATYLSSATATPIPLIETSVDELNARQGGWKTSATSTNPRWYQWQNSTGAALVGFENIPPTATSGGYPTVRLVVSLYTALTSGASLPATLLTVDPMVFGLCRAWAALRDPDRLPYFEEQYENAKNALGVYVARRQRNNPPAIEPGFGLGVASA